MVSRTYFFLQAEDGIRDFGMLLEFRRVLLRTGKTYRDRQRMKNDTSKGASCPSAIGFALEEMVEKINKRFDQNKTTFTQTTNNTNAPKCPECNEPLIYEGGCNRCVNCGWSKCSI